MILYNNPLITLVMVLGLLLYENKTIFASSNNTGFSDTRHAKIGFLIPSKNDKSVVQAAELAIEHASGNGYTFELVTRSCEGPWGIGSKQAVYLVYDDEVSVIVGALDGRNAHLAEQVAAKNHVAMLSTRSGDPTLSRAYVPWYYRLVPDHRQQAEAIVSEIHKFAQNPSVAIITFGDYDGKKAADEVIKASFDNQYLSPFQTDEKDPDIVMQQLSDRNPDVVIVAGMSNNALELIRKIKIARKPWKIYAFSESLMIEENFGTEVFHEVHTVFPADFSQTRWQAFRNAFHEKYGKNPCPPLAWVYDGVRLAMEAVKKYGTDPNAIRKNFSQLQFNGITGKVTFDKLGNRDTQWEIVILEHKL